MSMGYLTEFMHGNNTGTFCFYKSFCVLVCKGIVIVRAQVHSLPVRDMKCIFPLAPKVSAAVG